MMSRRSAVPFDPYHFEKLARSGTTLPADAVFRDIYRRHHWAGSESASGAGAALEQTRRLQTELPLLLQDLGIRSLLDLPCGDYSWMQTLNLTGTSYVGGDLLPELIDRLNAAYADSSHRFQVLDITGDALPAVDLLFCRDCLVHLSYSEIRRAFDNIARSGIPYVLLTTFPETCINEDIVTGDWRVLNLEQPPFNLPPPLRLLNEGCTEGGGLFADKSLGLWRTQDLTRGPDLQSFSTARLLAERLTPGHFPDLCRMDQNEAFMAQLGGTRDENGTANYLRVNLDHWAEHGFGLWMLRERATRSLIGRAVLRHLEVDGVDEVEVGYGFLPEYWGSGLATEVARACVRIGLDQLGLTSLVAITTPANTASHRVLRKAGLAYERDIIHAGIPVSLFRTTGVVR